MVVCFNKTELKFCECGLKDFRTAVRKIEELPVFAIRWGYNVIILQKVKNLDERLWYAQKSLTMHGVEVH